jgi:DNA-binding protein WhiA
MSFSSTAKNEVCHAAAGKPCCKLAELSAILHLTGSISVSAGRFTLRADTENAAVARRAFSLIKELFDIPSNIEMKKNRLKKNHIYSLVISEGGDALQVLQKCGVVARGNIFKTEHVRESIVSRRCCKTAFLRGAFLGGGSISNPEKMYHLEFVSGSETFANDLARILNRFDLNAKLTERKNHSIVYLKEGDKISAFLSLIGAHTAMLAFENIRVLKEMRNNVNRAVNCETANLSKTVNAAVRQIENILYIKDHMGFEKLPPALREVAELRINQPEATLDELKDQLSEPIGRSGVNHRLRRLNEIAEDLKNHQGGK